MTMKLGYEIAYGLIAIALIAFLIRSLHNEKKIAHDIQWIMGWACVSVLAGIAQLAAGREIVADISYAVFFISIDWLLASIVWFANDYCACHLEQ